MKNTFVAPATSTLLATSILCAFAVEASAPPEQGETIHRVQNVPNSTTPGTFSRFVQGDEWTFSGLEGDWVRIRLDTRRDYGDSSSPKSGLDALLILMDASGNVVDWADDNRSCSVRQVCGYYCPEIDIYLPKTGDYTVIARDFDTASTTGEQCNGGSYTMRIIAPGGVTESFSSAPTVDNGIVNEPADLQEQLDAAKGSGL
jgi:hypothetical protein